MADPEISSPAGYVPTVAVTFGSFGGVASSVDLGNPLPVATAVRAATIAPLAGRITAGALLGPFDPELGRPIHLMLAGDWSGVVQLLRSTDGGATSQPLTLAGAPWARFTVPVNEPVWSESESGASFYLSATIEGGTLDYRVSQ